MGCASCGTANGLPKGCKNNGACGVSGCDKLSVFDWLSDMEQPVEALRCYTVEVRFKNDRKEFYENESKLPLAMGDVVVVESSPGHDVGVVSMTGELVRIQMQNKGVRTKNISGKIFRKAHDQDINTWHDYRTREHGVMLEARKIARSLGLEMKISDVEFQGDGQKAIFYYTSDSRVDFRQLIREFAAVFKCRIEMRQIGYRQEASKLGGIGSCGRELCCSTWLTDFRSVSTAAARYQQLSINPQKIAGQCGKLKCCLNYELDSYLEALNDFPPSDASVSTKNGKANCVKIDVFKKEVWLAYENSANFTWYKFSLADVNSFLADNKRGTQVEPLEDLYKSENETLSNYKIDFIEQDDIEQFEKKHQRKKKQRRKPNPNQQQRAKNQSGEPGTQGQRRNKNRSKSGNRNTGNRSANKPNQAANNQPERTSQKTQKPNSPKNKQGE
ncbi:MAG: regulatory iron-sulfur-containing complex subunit RicT [Weeksellaceae bacterium]|nr:regulatory iron-sulfur-containing complex subunit RicT [Weeksellaceae bacterium]